MFYDSNKFKVMEAGARFAWMQQQINTQNIANVETPGYKSYGMSFQETLRDAQDGEKIDRITARIETNDDVSTRPDGNNVDLEAESLALYKAYTQYSMLINKISGEFDKYGMVLNANM
ncbi:MAG: flagellar basal body rod protein FlgB [Oscillospiraceae bacterium]